VSTRKRAVEWFVPASVTDPDERARARFTVTGLLWGLPIVAMFAVLFAVNRMWAELGFQVFTTLSIIGLLALLKRTGRLRLTQQLALVMILFAFGPGSLAQTPADPSSVFFLVIVPLLAVFFFGLRQGVVWLVTTLFIGVPALLLGQAGYTWPDLDPSPGVTMSMNFTFCLIVVLLFAITYVGERQRALDELRQAQGARNAFLANVSHEIRTPMNGMLGMTQVLLHGELSADQREHLLVIHRSGQALVSLINDVLDSAKLEAGQLSVSSAPFSLGRLLGDVRELFEPLAVGKGLTLVVEALPEQVVVGDALRVRQVLSNLLSNAIKFTASGGVRLAVARPGDADEVCFSVEDTGAGIPESLRPRLFQPFQQGDASTTRRFGGTGLGLSLSAELAQLLRGRLEFDASATIGARFVFTLPLARSTAEVDPSPSSSKVARAPRGGPVLVVDDNAVNLAVARAFVVRAGFEVHTAQSGREALERIGEQPWVAVLMDVMMPEMDGLEATRRIRALPAPQGQVPIIGVTASAMPHEVAACREAGMNQVVTKPVRYETLFEMLTGAVR
jgi:signal transduction histidine kinase/CheY-like chemotaxis protein